MCGHSLVGGTSNGWPPQRSHVEARYATLPFPYAEIVTPLFELWRTLGYAEQGLRVVSVGTILPVNDARLATFNVVSPNEGSTTYTFENFFSLLAGPEVAGVSPNPESDQQVSMAFDK